MLTAAVTTPTFKRRRATCWSDRPRSPNLPFAQSFRPTERTVVLKWRHRSPTFNRVYPNPLCHAECARPSCPHAAAPRKMIARTIMGPIKPLLPARGPSGRSLGAREGPLAAPRASRWTDRTDSVRFLVLGLMNVRSSSDMWYRRHVLQRSSSWPLNGKLTLHRLHRNREKVTEIRCRLSPNKIMKT